MNVQHSLIQELMFYELELNHNITEATKNICCAKVKVQLKILQNFWLPLLSKNNFNWIYNTSLNYNTMQIKFTCLRPNLDIYKEQNLKGQFMSCSFYLIFILIKKDIKYIC